MTAQQKDIGSGWGPTEPQSPKEVPCGSSTPAAAHATSPRAVAVRLSSVPFIVKFDQAGTGDSRWVHSRPVQRVVGTVG